jgi:TetR/AcrR family transcriptional regulator
MPKQRARSNEEKAQRKQSIVSALYELMERHPGRLPTATEIAQAAGVTKGVIYIYFATREEIFLTLFAQLGQEFLQKMQDVITGPDYEPARVRQVFVECVCSNPVLMQLGLAAPTILEQNVSKEFIREFKQWGAQGLTELATHWTQQEPELEVEKLRAFVLRQFYLAQLLWQHHNPPDHVREAMDASENWMLSGDLEKELSESFDWMWLGLKECRGQLDSTED